MRAAASGATARRVLMRIELYARTSTFGNSNRLEISRGGWGPGAVQTADERFNHTAVRPKWAARRHPTHSRIQTGCPTAARQSARTPFAALAGWLADGSLPPAEVRVGDALRGELISTYLRMAGMLIKRGERDQAVAEMQARPAP